MSNTVAEVQLKRRFGLVQSISILTGFIIGTGIYLSPTYIMQMVAMPGLTLCMWVLAGCINTVAALTFAELGTTYPVIGDCYVYVDMFFGDFLAFMWLWKELFITRPGSNAVKALFAAASLTKYFFPECTAPESAIKLIGIVIIGGMTFMNGVNVKMSGRFQVGCAVITITSLIVIIAIGFAHTGQGNTENFQDLFALTGNLDIGNMCLAFYAMLYAYNGWYVLNFVVEEVQNPERTLPRAVTITMLGVIVLYVLTNVQFIAVLGAEGIQQSQAVAMTFAEQTMGRASVLIALAIAVTCCGSLNGGTILGSRLGFAAARRGHLPNILGFINLKSFAPVAALLLQLGVIILMILFCDVYTLLSNMVFLSILTEMLVVYGLIYRRIKEPHLYRPFKMPIWMHALYGIVSTVLVFVPLITKPKESGMGLLITIVTGIPYYLLFVKKIIPMEAAEKYNRAFIIKTQKMLWSAPQDRPDALQ